VLTMLLVSTRFPSICAVIGVPVHCASSTVRAGKPILGVVDSSVQNLIHRKISLHKKCNHGCSMMSVLA
jgi:hypothetical protein